MNIGNQSQTLIDSSSGVNNHADNSQELITRLVTDNLDIWTTAIKKRSARGRGSNKKIELTGIKKLRELILELAVRGKLVPQDANDEPASVLLEKITAEKELLIKDKKIKKTKVLPEITEDEKLFELSNGWQWCRLGNAGIGATGKTPSTKNSNYFDGDIQFVGPGQITPQGKLLRSDKTLTELGLEQSTSAVSGDILMVCIGGSIGKSTIANERVAFNQQINAMHPLLLVSNFLKITVSTNSFYESVLEKSTGSATPIINRGKWEELIIPISPLAEQHRIVAKVDELMRLCDQLEQQTEDSITAHQTLVETLLATLSNSETPAEFKQNWTRIAAHFDTLFTTEHSIDQLKQTILQLAVMGKLVPQNPNDEPASVLLEKIAAEKEQLIKDKKIKKQKPLPEITDDEKPFELPSGWTWSRIWDIANIITSGSRDWAKHYAESGAIFVTMGNLSRNDYRLRLDTVRYVNPPIGGEGSRTKLKEYDLLISITGDVGNLGLIPAKFGEAYINQHTCLLRFMPECHNRYFPELMRSPWAKFQFDAPQRGIKNSFRLGDVGEMIISIPPLAEQHRIVKKVDELMTLCDQLKNRINDAQTSQLNLADAVVKQAVY